MRLPPTLRRAGRVLPGRLALVAAVALVPVVVLAASSIMLASHQVTSDVDKRVQGAAAVSAIVIGQQTDGLAALVESYATRSYLTKELAAGAAGGAGVAAQLAGLGDANPAFGGAFITDLAGNSLASYPPDPTVAGQSFAFRNWYLGLEAAPSRPYVSEAYRTGVAGQPLVVAVAVFVRAPGGRPVGIVGALFSLKVIVASSAAVARGQGVNLMVTDQAGTLLSNPNPSGLVSVAGDPRVSAALSGGRGLRRYTPRLQGGGHGPQVLSAYAPVPQTGWTVTASVPSRTAFAGWVRLRDTVLAVTALLVLMVLAAAALFVRADRRRAQSELRGRRQDTALARMVDSTDAAFIAIDATGAITAWSTQAEQLFGWPVAEAAGRALVDTIIPSAQAEAHRHGLANYRPGSFSAVVGKRLDITAVHRDGREIPVELGVWANDDGEGFSAFVHDITERVNAQIELEAARDQALQASNMKSEFLANMSHEIRTPMNGVIGMSGLLLDTDLDDMQREFAATVSSSAEALLTVINDILDFSKIEAGRLAIESIPFDVRAVVEESTVLLVARAQQTGIQLTCQVDPTLPSPLLGDPGRLRQVLLNLLGNAVKFTTGGQVDVTARRAGPGPEGAVIVEVAVRDNGIGMSDATLEHLFESFTQADNSTTRRYGGTGLGLAISRQLVELMGGTLTALSEIGVGSTFTAVIPFLPDPQPLPQTDDHRIGDQLKDPSGANQPRTSDPAPAFRHTTPGVPSTTLSNAIAASGRQLPEPTASLGLQSVGSQANGAALLVVEDNRINQIVTVASLSRHGYRIDIANDGADALEHLDRHHYDAVLMDCQMPVMDGYEATRELRQREGNHRHTPVIALTAAAMPSDRADCLAAGMDAYLTKPFNHDNLLTTVQRWTEPGDLALKT